MSDQTNGADPKQAPPMPVDVARHLAAITREAASKAYDADSGVAGKLTVWLITVLATLNAGGLVAALENPSKLACPYEAQISLLVGLVGTILGGVFGMVHYNFLADRWRIEMHMELEGVEQISSLCNDLQANAKIADHCASACLSIAGAMLVVAGIFAI